MTTREPGPTRRWRRRAPSFSLSERIIAWMLNDEAWRDTVLGDLREECAQVANRDGRLRARWWYWRETFALLTQRLIRSRPSGPSHKDPLMRTLLSETRLAVRALWRQPLASLVIIATFAIGLGVNAATFGFADALLLRPFPIPNVDRLVVLSELSPDMPYPQESVAPANYADLRSQLGGALIRMSTVSWWDVNLSGTEQSERIAGSQVGADFFAMLGITPDAGRFFLPADEAIGAPRAAVISHRLWQRRFDASPDVVGSVVRLDGEPYTIVGLAPDGFDFPNGSDVWTPLILDADDRLNRVARYLTVIGELAPGASIGAAQTEMTAAYARLKSDHVTENHDYHLAVLPFVDAMVDYGVPTIIYLWQATALLLLLIAGTNIANLWLARGAERQREMAVRLAVGAGRWRLVRQLLLEGLLLAMAAIPAALLVATATMHFMRGLLPAELIRFLPGWTMMGVTGRVVVLTAAAAAISALLIGLIPALRASRVSLTTTLKDGGRAGTSGLTRSRLRRGLVVAEVALALPLLFCAGLAALAGHRMANGPQGYTPDGLVRIRTSLSAAAYPDADARRVFTTRLQDEASRTPGIDRVVTTSVAPSSGGNQTRRVVVDGRVPDPGGPRAINYRAVSGGYFDVLGIPIIEGRGLTPQDRRGAEHVAVVSQALARLYWPGESPVGRRVKLSPTAAEWVTIVGVCGNVLDNWFNARFTPAIYVPVDQWPSADVHLLARGRGDAADQIAGLRAALARVDPQQPAYAPETMQQAIDLRTAGLRFLSALMAVFGGLALLLSAAGVYSVMAHYVAQRRHEIGVRMALGASAKGVLALTLGQGLRMAGLGILLGTAAGIGLTRIMESALFGVIAFEPWLFIVGPIVLAAIAALATMVPAQAAMRIDPARVLRQ